MGGETLASLTYLGPCALDKSDFGGLTLPGSVSQTFKIKSKRHFLKYTQL